MTVIPVATTDENRRPFRVPGVVGTASGLMFAAMSVWEHAAGLGPGRRGPADVANQLGFAVALAGYSVHALGLVRARPAAGRRGALLFPVLLAIAWTSLAAGDLLQLATPLSPEADPLNAIGGLGHVVGLTASASPSRSPLDGRDGGGIGPGTRGCL